MRNYGLKKILNLLPNWKKKLEKNSDLNNGKVHIGTSEIPHSYSFDINNNVIFSAKNYNTFRSVVFNINGKQIGHGIKYTHEDFKKNTIFINYYYHAVDDKYVNSIENACKQNIQDYKTKYFFNRITHNELVVFKLSKTHQDGSEYIIYTNKEDSGIIVYNPLLMHVDDDNWVHAHASVNGEFNHSFLTLLQQLRTQVLTLQ